MKLSKALDNRLLMQLTLLSILTVLPVVVIAFNGFAAVEAILVPISEDDGLNFAEPFVNVEQVTDSVPLLFGIYDPESIFNTDKALKLRHEYFSWASFDTDASFAKLSALEEQGFQLLLTIEPWPQPDSAGELLPGIVAGEYDQAIDKIASMLQRLRGPVYISWGHEMDQDLSERYPWSAADPLHYVAAYRYVVDRITPQVDTELHWVWAGVLKEGSLRYWPGEQYADFVGMPIYSFPQFDQKSYGFIRDFRVTFEEKRKVVKELNKPLMITELGVSGSTDFESFWLHQAFLSLHDYRDLAAVVFFYARDTEGAWGRDIETPDWRVHEESIRGLVQWNLR